jgi:toxin ParE1/3/4
MPKYDIRILAPAWRELEEIAEYHLRAVGPFSAKRITDRILDSLKRLESFPLSCPMVPDPELQEQGYRMIVCQRYLCIYRLIGNTVNVYHIADGASEYGKLLIP